MEKYEAYELTEEPAAAAAPEHHGSKVLVRVDLNAVNDRTVDQWAGTQRIEPMDQSDTWGGITCAFVDVSLLGR